MSLLIYIIIFTLMGGVLSVLAASAVLLVPERHLPNLLPHGVSFAIGAMLSVSLFGLIPHAFENATPEIIHDLSVTILIGLLTFFLLEKLLIWRHCHSGACVAHSHLPSGTNHRLGSLIIIGDGIHNFVDGVLIAATFLTDVNLGIVTSLAVAAHEIPQEVGDFMILLQSGYSRAKALLFNVFSSITTVFGGVLAYYLLGDYEHFLPYLLVIAASSFLYIAVADLIPTLHKETELRSTLEQMILIGLGVALIAWLHGFAH